MRIKKEMAIRDLQENKNSRICPRCRDTQRENSVDIVVPVYNGFEDLVKCVESLEKHTDLTTHRVILIDDCSPDDRVRAYLMERCSDAAAAEYGLTAVYNSENKGFSANVNIGLAASERDTILLNSDTIVTKGWVEKLQACAYRSVRIATVTPLSNAATLASVPVFLQDNPVPDGFTVDSYAELVERVSLHRYPRITVAVGFCMYVKQEAYAAVGPFDAKTFGRGYGEENDFCNRCGMLGYIHVLCDDTFIYHRGTGSFETEEKKALLEEHTKILRRRYPEQMKANDDYCRENPDQEIRDNLLLYQKLENGKKNLLYFLHLDFREIAQNNIGGTQLHVKDLVVRMQDLFNVFVASRDGSDLRLTVYAGDDMISLKFPIGPEEPFPVFYDETLAAELSRILDVFRIDLVHVHHTQGLSLDIYTLCREKKIPVLATLHDYFYACPTTKLLREDGTFCPQEGTFTDPSAKICAKCLYRNCGYYHVRIMERWRRECRQALSVCEKIIFPSESAKEIMLSACPELRSVSMVIAHGTDAVQTEQVRPAQIGRIITTNQMHSRLDQQPGGEGAFHYVSGWAYLDGYDSSKASIVIEITDRSNTVHHLAVKKSARMDVAKSAADMRVLWCGIHAVFHVPHMPDGRYHLRILLLTENGTYTDGKVYAGHYRSLAESDRLHVAFLGGVTPAKGSRLLHDIIQSKDSRFHFFVFGEVGDPSVKAPNGADNVFFSGVYRKEDIYDLLRLSRIDVACILPKWAETFCYTLSEAWACGIPVVGTDLGAVGERIRKTGAGWLVSPDASAEDVLDLLGRIRKDPHSLAKKKKIAVGLSHHQTASGAMEAACSKEYSPQMRDPQTELRSLQDMWTDYEVLYADMLQRNSAGTDNAGTELTECDLDAIFQGLAAADPSVTGSRGAAAMNRLREENALLKASMEMMQNTTSYRFARKIAEANIPFKEPLKKLLKKN